MYRFEDVRTVHLEVTSKCNARCPMCLRNVLGGKVNPFLPITELTLADVQKIFPETLLRQLNRVFMCGNYGDPIMAAETLEIFRYFRAANKNLHLEMFTNGSARGEDWWRELAKVVTSCRFSVDGLGDTNAIYRRGTKWPVILRNMEAYLGAGGDAEWDYIVFRHNEMQVDDARALAKRLGFRAFNVKKTGRFFSNTKITVKDQQEVHGLDGQVEYYLEPPENPRYRNSALAKENEIVARHGTLKNFFAQTPITCKVAKERSLFVSAEGLVFPCCWTANQLYPWYYPEKGAPIWKMIEALPSGLDSLNAKKTTIAEIVSGPFFQTKLPDSWSATSGERLFVCAKTCGQGFDAFTAQFQSAGQAPQEAATQAVIKALASPETSPRS